MSEDEQDEESTGGLSVGDAFTVGGKMFFSGTTDPHAVAAAIIAC